MLACELLNNTVPEKLYYSIEKAVSLEHAFTEPESCTFSVRWTFSRFPYTRGNITCLIILDIMLNNGWAGQLNQRSYHAWSWLTVHQPLFMLDIMSDRYWYIMLDQAWCANLDQVWCIKHEQGLINCQPWSSIISTFVKQASSTMISSSLIKHERFVPWSPIKSGVTRL